MIQNENPILREREIDLEDYDSLSNSVEFDAPTPEMMDQKVEEKNLHPETLVVHNEPTIISSTHFLFLPWRTILLVLICIGMRVLLSSKMHESIMPIPSFLDNCTLSMDTNTLQAINNELEFFHRERMIKAIQTDDFEMFRILDVNIIGRNKPNELRRNLETSPKKETEENVVIVQGDGNNEDDNTLTIDYDTENTDSEVEDEHVVSQASATEGQSGGPTENEKILSQNSMETTKAKKYWRDAALIFVFRDEDYFSMKWMELLMNLQRFLSLEEQLESPIKVKQGENKRYFLHSSHIYALNEKDEQSKALRISLYPRTVPSIQLYLPDNENQNFVEYFQERDVRRFIKWLESNKVYLPPMMEEDLKRMDT